MFSLIVATIDRVSELERLLDSIRGQSVSDCEVIVVDQNADDRLDVALQNFSDLRIVHLRAKPGVSRARNIGIKAAQGDIVATPDDDCWYPLDLLASVSAWFHGHPDYDVLFTGMRDEHNRPMQPKWPPLAGPCTIANVWDCTVAWSGFYRRKVIDTIGGFDECLGPGPDTLYKACEDLDFSIRPLEFNFHMWYEPGLSVYHPQLQSLDRLRKTTYPYAVACGYVSRAHHYSWNYMARRIGRSVGGAGLNLFRLNFPMTYLYLVRAVGQFRGYAFGSSHTTKIIEKRRQPSSPP